MQGVGFRPFVFRAAEALGLTGRVWNDGGGVTVEAEGPPDRLDELERLLREAPPPAARVERLEATALPGRPPATFEIAPSLRRGRPAGGLGADLATCPACLRELLDPADRRHRYPFTNCTNCGPRFTIVLRRALRPARHHHGRLHHVPHCAARVRRPAQPPLPRPAHRLPRLRAARSAL